MFQQEINLYKAFIAKEAPKTPLTWRRMWLCQSLFFFIFTSMAIHSFWQVKMLKQQKITLVNKAVNLEQQFYQLKSTFPSEFFNQEVELSIQNLNQQIITKQKILANIANRGLFSDNLIALSSNITSNVWLTKIVFDKSGDVIHLRGKSINAVDLQAFLSALTNNPIYRHFNLSVKSINDNTETEKKGDMLFEIDLTRAPL